MQASVKQATRKLGLKTVLRDNKKWPLVVVGAGGFDFGGAILSAKASERELNAASWAAKVSDVLVIDGLDKVSPAAQEKFISLFKDRRAGKNKLSDKVQMIIPVASAGKLSKKIKDLVMIYHA
jgi:hypothetical protein